MARRNMPWGNNPRPRSRCGACVVLNRGCNSQCIFAPYFHYEDGTTRFAAIRDVFTVRNVVNILTPLPVSDHFWASDTLLFEAQARLQDPVYGYVAHILSLQQQRMPLYPGFSEATLPPFLGEASSGQMPPPDDIDELGAVVFGNRRPH
ncbi:LOB domain-containing protein 29-like [Diospyros lotus]|uniref:LOB domain-containing protein 29-like n=1 Tax=Diospyros lotus TaxID=55363 RepID=UPI002256CE22|nr:LOB domain-containing protein 29-like [Diospyros lotus]